ncbi:hypothetical protein [Haloferula sp.]|uniref:hypothetical protein n=1 Tax=Haloferula sp. TaxID=2497595 RepID=UPI0032A04FC2
MSAPRRIPLDRRLKHLALAGALVAISSNCSTAIPHNGRLPFTWMERAPTPESESSLPMTVVHRHEASGTLPGRDDLKMIQAGDVIAFTMSHKEAWQYLRKGKIQKIPYELFRYGHLALVVPDPNGTSELRLLQVAMKQAVSAVDGLDYLNDKTWEIHRPPTGSVDPKRLREFTIKVTENASDPKHAYDYVSVIGWKNSPWQPDNESDIGEKFSCATLVVAGLHYSGYQLDAVHRGGRLDLVTPRQVVESRGVSVNN